MEIGKKLLSYSYNALNPSRYAKRPSSQQRQRAGAPQTLTLPSSDSPRAARSASASTPKLPTPLCNNTMVRQATKKVLVGDAAKRWALTMPPTLAMFKSRVRQVYGLDGRTPFEIWLPPYARGAAPGRGRELVATESDYACVIDGDVLVLRLGDREVAPTPELVRAFDGDVETVYDADYRKPEPVKDLRGASVSSSRYQNFRDAIDVPNPYVTTYKTAFTPQSRFLEDAPPTDKMAAHYTCPHGAATTTYRAMFAGREPRDFHDSILEEPSILRRFVAPAPPARPPTTSTSRADFVAFPQGPKRAPAPRALGRAPPGARWKPSEYRAAYAGRAPYAAPGLGAGIQYSVLGDDLSAAPSPPRFATTTYRGHFSAKPMQGSRKIFAEPVDRAVDDVSVLSG